MLYSGAIVAFVWFLVAISTSSAEEVKTPDEIAEIQLSVKTAFAKQAREISDLLHMFIALINRADETEGRELGLPEITTTIPKDLESASLEELFDRFETAAQSFRTRFLKYLKSTENPYPIVTPTISTVVELNNGEDLTKYIYTLENDGTIDSGPNSARENEHSATDPDVNESDSSGEQANLAIILANSKAPDSDLKIKCSSSSSAPDLLALPSQDHSLFILSNEEATDSEFETEPDTNDSSGDGSLVFFLSNEEDMNEETEDSSYINGRTLEEDITLTLLPVTEENAGSFIEETSEPFRDENSDTTTELFSTEATLDSTEEASPNETPMFTTTIDQLLNGAATFIFKATTEDSSTDDSTVEVTESPLTTMDGSYEDTSVSDADYDSDKATNIYSADDSDEENIEVLSTSSYDNSGEVSMENEDSDAEKYDESDEEATSFSNKDKSLEEMVELVKILREAAEKYDPKESEKLKLEDTGASELGESSVERFSNGGHLETVSGRTMEYVSTSTDSSKAAHSADPQIRDISGRSGLMQIIPVYSHLDVVIGVPGEAYPNFTNIAVTSFTCEGKETPGLYADIETRCQVFHACWPLRRESYLCPVGSTFNQQILSCDYWFNSTCSLSQDYYDINQRLQDYPVQDEDGLHEYIEDDVVYPYNFRIDHSHPIFNEMKFLPFLYKIVNYSTKRRGLESGTEIDYSKKVKIEFDENSTLPDSEDFTQQESSTDFIDSTNRFRELLRSFIASEISASEDSSLPEMKLQEQKYIYEKILGSKLDRSGNSPDATTDKEDLDTTTTPNTEENRVLNKSKQYKSGKKQIAPAIVFKVLETAENVVNKGILPFTRDMLAANYIKLYKKKKM